MLTALRLHLYNNLAQNLEPFCSLSLKHQEHEYPPHGNWEAATGKESPIILPVMAPVPPSFQQPPAEHPSPYPAPMEGSACKDHAEEPREGSAHVQSKPTQVHGSSPIKLGP